MSTRLLLAGLLCVVSALGEWTRAEEDQPAVTAADLLKPEFFPEARCGMSVDSAQDGARVVTTGAEFIIFPSSDTIICQQRIASGRRVAKISLPPGALGDIKLAHRSSGAAIYRGAESGTTLRVNGESLLMVSPGRDGDITAELLFTPDYHSEYKGNYNFFDPVGGISFFEHGKHPDAKLEAASDPVKVTWHWKAGDVFWAAVSPPKAYDWQRSISDRVVMHGSSIDRFMYPCDLTIYRFRKALGANVLYLHDELMYEHWQLSLVPRDLAGFKRVMNTAHELGMKVIVYCSPLYFLKGTSLEDRAIMDTHGCTATRSGRNAKLYIEQATRVIKEFGADGLYFDGIYNSEKALAAEYYVTRAARELVGLDGLLYYHATSDVLGGGHLTPVGPMIHAYFDVVYKGEGEWSRDNPGYIRYILSSYNTSNSIAVQILDDRIQLTGELLDNWVSRANVRFFFPEHYVWGDEIALFRRNYWPRLTPQLQQELEPALLKPTGVFAEYRRSLRAGPATRPASAPGRS